MQMKLMLVDDHPLFLEGLQYLLETHGIVVEGTARNGKEALVKARIIRPDVILMDIRMPECNGLDALRLIKAEMPDIRIVMLTTSEENDDLYEAVKSGASGYLLKSTDAKALIDMLTALENGQTLLSEKFAGRLLEEFKKDASYESKSADEIEGEVVRDNLTDRQMEVLELVAEGMTYKEAGQALSLSERTVKYHMGRIIELLHLKNRAQVIAYAARIGLIEN